MVISCYQIQTIDAITLFYKFLYYLPLNYDLLIKLPVMEM